MLMKIVIVIALGNCVLGSDEFFTSLYGVHGGNRVSLCMDPGRTNTQCAGVILQRHWVLVRGTCLANMPLHRAIVLRTRAADCESVGRDVKVKDGRKIQARFFHTLYPDTDACLVCLDRPYDALELVQNDSKDTLKKLEPWLSNTFNQYPVAAPRAKVHEHREMLFSSPVKMFMTTVVLPLTSFIVFFLFVTFFTGSNKNTVSYRSLHNDKEDNSFA